MTYNVIVTPTADAEAMEAVAWYAERSTDAAQRWYAGLTSVVAAEAPAFRRGEEPRPCLLIKRNVSC